LFQYKVHEIELYFKRSLTVLLSGEKSLTKKVIIESANLLFDGSAVSWQNLPVLTTTIICDNEILSPDAIINFLTITVENIYNLPEFFDKDAEHKVGTAIYIDNEVTNCK